MILDFTPLIDITLFSELILSILEQCLLSQIGHYYSVIMICLLDLSWLGESFICSVFCSFIVMDDQWCNIEKAARLSYNYTTTHRTLINVQHYFKNNQPILFLCCPTIKTSLRQKFRSKITFPNTLHANKLPPYWSITDWFYRHTDLLLKAYNTGFHGMISINIAK